jgi:polysaccharide chain length determinant protein (PEP-CTERM system associated)
LRNAKNARGVEDVSTLARTPRDIFQSILAAGWRRRYALCMPIAIMPFIGFAASLVAPKTYEAKMSVLVQEPARMNPFLNDISIGTNVKERMPALSALLRSEHVLGRVLLDLGELEPDADMKTRAKAINELARAISVQLTGSELVDLRLRGPRAYGLGRKLEAVGTRFIERLLSPERGALVSSESFLDEQLKRRRGDLDVAEYVLSEFRKRNADKLPALLNATIQRLATLAQKREERMMELATAEKLFTDLRQRLAGTNPVVGRLEDAIVQTTSELASLRARYTDQHSDVLAAERKLARLQEERQAILDSSSQFQEMDMDRLWNMAAGADPGVDKAAVPLLISQVQKLQEAEARRTTLRQDIEQLTKTIDETQASIAQFAPIEQHQKRLERAVEVARELHDSLAKRSEMAKLTGALGRYETPERIKIIDPPADPTGPVTPGRALFVLGALIAGVVLGCGLATLLEFLDPTMRRLDAIAQATGLPIVATINRLDPLA